MRVTGLQAPTRWDALMNGRTTRTAAAIVLLGLATGWNATAADASRRKSAPADYVVAESRFGHGKITGAVRQGRVGLEVETPGGNWLDCGRSCSETLRTEVLDFWENKGAGKDRTDNPAGIFGDLTRRRSY